MDQEVVKPSDVQSVTVKPEDVSPVAAQPPPDEGGFLHWGSRPSDRQRATEQLAARGGAPVRASAPREDTTFAGMPPEMLPFTLVKVAGPIVGAARAATGLAGRATAGLAKASPLVTSDLIRRGLEAAGLPSPVATGIGVLVGGRLGAGKAAAEAPLSAEGQALATAERGATSGVPSGSVRPTPSSGSLVSTRVMPIQTGSGLPRPGAMLTDLRGNAIRPMGGFLTNSEEAVPSAIPPNTGGPLTESVRAVPKRGVASVASPRQPMKMTPSPEAAESAALPQLTRKMLNPEERAAFDQMVSEGHPGKRVYEHLSALRQAQRLATALSQKFGGGS